MPSFEDREKSFERKFEHDQELAFKVRSRRRKLLGLWAAQQLGLAGQDAEAYANGLAALGLHRGGDEEEVEHIARDFAAKGIALDRAHIALESERFDRAAKKELGAAT
ncbi:MAG TPA: DUF1476 domain-containing protein [Stellaceae bacterium]|nr:DUF1476 domain-containing protein [Stellaceae bacterium]